MVWHFEIKPGKSVGPVKLGMTRLEIEHCGLGPVQWGGMSDYLGFFPPETGIMISMNRAQRCASIQVNVLSSAKLRLLGRDPAATPWRDLVQVVQMIAPDASVEHEPLSDCLLFEAPSIRLNGSLRVAADTFQSLSVYLRPDPNG